VRAVPRLHAATYAGLVMCLRWRVHCQTHFRGLAECHGSAADASVEHFNITTTYCILRYKRRPSIRAGLTLGRRPTPQLSSKRWGPILRGLHAGPSAADFGLAVSVMNPTLGSDMRRSRLPRDLPSCPSRVHTQMCAPLWRLPALGPALAPCWHRIALYLQSMTYDRARPAAPCRAAQRRCEAAP